MFLILKASSRSTIKYHFIGGGAPSRLQTPSTTLKRTCVFKIVAVSFVGWFNGLGATRHDLLPRIIPLICLFFLTCTHTHTCMTFKLMAHSSGGAFTLMHGSHGVTFEKLVHLLCLLKKVGQFLHLCIYMYMYAYSILKSHWSGAWLLLMIHATNHRIYCVCRLFK